MLLSKMNYTKFTILILFFIILEVTIFVGCQKDISKQATPKITESGSHLILGFSIPDQSTPERTLRTFWWAIKNGRKDIALACVDRKKLAEGPGIDRFRNIDEFISEFSQLDTSNFRFLVGETKVSIESPQHCMDYDMEKRKDGKWLIISIHP